MAMEWTPLRMRPCYKEYLWGGTRLRTEFGKQDAPEVTAESWELASHADGKSTVAEGALTGKTLAELDRLPCWGSECRDGDFPILVKLIDAKRDLSIQVHPSDATADRSAGEQGKAEMWYIVDCEPQAAIYFGFSQRVTKEEFLRRAEDGSICEVLNRVPVKRGDVFYILPGTIHAIGAGIMIAEIQQNSNTTFRVYDYQRRDANGNLRPLHLKRASEVVDYTPIVPEECKANNVAVFPGFTIAEMFACRYFHASRIDVRERVTLKCDGTTFQHVLCVEGDGEIAVGERRWNLYRGDSYFLPAAMGEYEIRGACRVLLSRIQERDEE